MVHCALQANTWFKYAHLKSVQTAYLNLQSNLVVLQAIKAVLFKDSFAPLLARNNSYLNIWVLLYRYVLKENG